MFDSLREQEQFLQYDVTLTHLVSFPSHHFDRLFHTTQGRWKGQSSSGSLRDPKPVTMCQSFMYAVV